jgi:hypothetical protein
MPGWFFARKFGSGNSANTRGKNYFIAIFLENGHFKQIMTVLFNGLSFLRKNRLTCRLWGRPVPVPGPL